jgi:signal transduction histidine kinase
VVGDKRRLGQVLQNLLENADRYGGGPTSVLLGGDEGYLDITVDDAGPGVAEHERTHIFNRFARGRSGVATTEGSGLGLALVAEHVRLHGGTISAEESPAGGARFHVRLPTSTNGEEP